MIASPQTGEVSVAIKDLKREVREKKRNVLFLECNFSGSTMPQNLKLSVHVC